jgi:hypothetical protein
MPSGRALQRSISTYLQARIPRASSEHSELRTQLGCTYSSNWPSVICSTAFRNKLALSVELPRSPVRIVKTFLNILADEHGSVGSTECGRYLAALDQGPRSGPSMMASTSRQKSYFKIRLGTLTALPVLRHTCRCSCCLPLADQEFGEKATSALSRKAMSFQAGPSS